MQKKCIKIHNWLIIQPCLNQNQKWDYITRLKWLHNRELFDNTLKLCLNVINSIENLNKVLCKEFVKLIYFPTNLMNSQEKQKFWYRSNPMAKKGEYVTESCFDQYYKIGFLVCSNKKRFQNKAWYLITVEFLIQRF